MVDVKSFASEATNTLSGVFMDSVEKGAEIVENIFSDPSIDKDLMQKRMEGKLITYEDAINMLTYINIEDGYKTLNEKMYPFFYRLFNLNIQERAETLRLLGNDTVFYGDSDLITPLMITPKYAEGMAYSGFMKNAKISERNGQISTMYDTVTNSNFYNKGQLYKKTVNLYPDENDTGINGESDYEFNKWDANDPNSILFKTKNLFRQRKINTLISRFGTHADEGGGTIEYNGENGDPLYGESRGRNLLTKDAEQNGGYYRVNGYNNPYCRVWTHHYQYGKYVNTIRPFIDETGKAVTNEEFHKWPQFAIDDDIIAYDNSQKKPWGWKNGNQNWDKSVLDKETGLVNFTPIYRDPGKDANIHTKDCMFSIENLAWKDFDPYSFERALSWEQRGPNGGRIMWFPPYGISFNETVMTEWTENKFIGRGESVFSYANTKRSGTLEFLMVVDHPSVVDYALWDADSGENVTDTDLLRFFAGCDSETVINAAKPTPLTDEYLNFGTDDNLITTSKDNKTYATTEKTFKSKLFFPNNYTGLWDIDVFDSSPLGYIFDGKGANTEFNAKEKSISNLKYPIDDIERSFWLPLAYSVLSDSYGEKNGYEMLKEKYGVSFDKNKNLYEKYSFKRDSDISYKDNETGHFSPKTSIYYRVDGVPIRPGEDDKVNYTIATRSVIFPHEGNYDENKDRWSDNSTEIVKQPQKDRVGTEKEKIIYKDTDVFNKLEKELTNNYASNTYGQIINGTQCQDLTNGNRNCAYVSEGCIPFTVFSSIVALAGYGDGDVTYKNNNEIITKVERKKIVTDLIEGIADEQAKKRAEEFYKILSGNSDKINKMDIMITGNASQDGTGDPKGVCRNVYLAGARAVATKKIMETISNNNSEKIEYKLAEQFIKSTSTNNVNGETSKNDRCAVIEVTISYKNEEIEHINYDENEKPLETISDEKYKDFFSNAEKIGYVFAGGFVDNYGVIRESSNYSKTGTSSSRPIFSKQEGEQTVKVVEGSQGKWIMLDKYIAMCKMRNEKDRMNGDIYTRALNKHDKTAVNKIRYDQEYYFFKKLKEEKPLVFDRLIDKLQYFDPAFHTMTPEGFNSRLTFLHQCTRQGDTTTASDQNSTSANNLAFGRPPFCVLRLGDFYKQMIVIKTLNLDYSVSDGIVWDLNQEGIGVQPLLCKVTIGFDFIGGGDLAGPVRRLQNAMSFNYYANASLYDNRADRPFYDWDYVTGKAVLDKDKSYAHSVTKDYEEKSAGDISEDEYVSGLSEEALDVRIYAENRYDSLR